MVHDLIKLRELSEQVVQETAEHNELGKKIFSSYNNYKEQVRAWNAISEGAYLDSLRLS